MIRIALYSSSPGEVQCIYELLMAYSIQYSWADCQVETLDSCACLRDMSQLVDVLISDVSNPGAVEEMKVQKARHPMLQVFPIAGAEIPPTVYVCPEIMPCGLFWRPVSLKSAQPVVEQMMARFYIQAVPRSENRFRISSKQKIQDVPFSMILFFEAREKKIALCMQDQELFFHGTLSQLEKELPKEFVRCHKSFLVNRRHVLSIDRRNSSLTLDNQMALPISRSYKKAFLEVFYDDA